MEPLGQAPPLLPVHQVDGVEFVVGSEIDSPVGAYGRVGIYEFTNRIRPFVGVVRVISRQVVSLHDVDARPIRKGRLGKPVEFGPGDLVTFPEGLDCVWKISKPVKKHYKFG